MSQEGLCKKKWKEEEKKPKPEEGGETFSL